MTKRLGHILRVAVLAIPAALVGCVPGSGTVDVFTEEEFEIIKTFSPLPDLAPNPTNKYSDDPRAAAFGQKLFFEKGYAKALKIAGTGLGNVGETGKVSCASCHDPKSWYSDSRSRPNATSVALAWTGRNSPGLVNAAYYKWGAWGGKDDNLWHQGANGPESGQNFGGNRLQYVHLIYRKYRDEYNSIFPIPLDPALDPAHPDAARFPAEGKPKAKDAPDGAWEMMTAEDRDHVNRIMSNTGKAIEAYERLLVSKNAPIDRYVAGDYTALTPAAKRGLRLFIGKAACVDCHSGPTFSDQLFHNTGVAQTVADTAARVDTGRYEDLQRTLSNTFNGMGKYSDDPEYGRQKLADMMPVDDMKGKFRTKSLRHVAETGPYMHNGSIPTLLDVVRFYNYGGSEGDFEGTKHPAMVPLHLTESEEADLVAFLEALTGDPVPDELGMDTSIPD